jgi:hypothetical protein
MKWGPASCPALSADFDEEEDGDVAGVWHASSVVPVSVSLPDSSNHAAAFAVEPLRHRPFPFAYLCRLLC